MRAFDGEFEFVYRVLRRFGVNAVDAEDVAQDVFVVMLRRWSDFDPQRPLRPWLLGITHRVAIHHLRRSWRETPSGFIELRDEGPPMDDQLSARGARQLVARALVELKTKHREVLVLHELEGVPMQEIAVATGEPLQTLYSRLKSAHRAFGRAVRRIGRFPSGTAAVVPFAPLLRHLRDNPPAPPGPGLRQRVLARARATAEHAASSFGSLRVPGTGLVYATGAALLGAGLLALISGARLLAVDRVPVAGQARAGETPARGALGFASRLEHHPTRSERRSFPTTLASVVPAPESLRTNLVGYWRFDDAGSKGARDFSGNGTDCVVHGDGGEAPGAGPPLPDRALGEAMSFGGQTWLECPQPRFARERSNELTLALWFRSARLRDGYRTMVARQKGEGQSDHFFLGIVNRHLFVQSDLFGRRVFGPPVTAGVWTHVAATFRDGVTILYVDGVEVGRTVGPKGPELELGKPLVIGGGMNGPAGGPATQRFRGDLDELLVYDRALARDEVAALAAGVQPPLSL
jgi:RNA polymerase sigma-70 factor (ECF subfamily)